MAVIPQIKWFARQMEERIEANSHKRGWGGSCEDWLFARLRQEVDELLLAIHDNETPEKIIRECADVGNFAMMIADNANKEALTALEAG